jgi:hypothetical protein
VLQFYFMEKELRCKLLVIGEFLHLISDRPVKVGDFAVHFDIHSKPAYITEVNEQTLYLDLGRKKLEATNSRALYKVPRLHDAFGDIKNFDPNKQYYFNLFLLSDGSLKKIMNDTVVCLPINQQTHEQATTSHSGL